MCRHIYLHPMSSRDKYVFGIQAFALSIRVECESAEMREMLNRFLLPPMARCEVPADAAQIKIEVLEESGGFAIEINAQKISSATNIPDAALATVKALDDAVVEHLAGLRAVHAGAARLKGRALLIPGSTHAGKSSLVAELLRRGAELFSDEYALVDKDGRVHSYPRPMLLRNGSPRQTLVLPEDLNASFAEQPAIVGWILAVDYDPGAGWEVEEISQGEAVMHLLRNTPHEMEQSPEMINFFLRLAANARCYSGTRGDVAEAAERILQLISRR